MMTDNMIGTSLLSFFSLLYNLQLLPRLNQVQIPGTFLLPIIQQIDGFLTDRCNVATVDILRENSNYLNILPQFRWIGWCFFEEYFTPRFVSFLTLIVPICLIRRHIASFQRVVV